MTKPNTDPITAERMKELEAFQHDLGELMLKYRVPKLVVDVCIGVGPQGDMCTALILREGADPSREEAIDSCIRAAQRLLRTSVTLMDTPPAGVERH